MTEAARRSLKTAKKPDPKRYAHEAKLRWEATGHQWKREDDGDLDIFAMSEANHNGPKCLACGYEACWHCVETPPPCPKAKKKKAKK